MRVLRFMILMIGMLGGAAGLSYTTNAAPLPVSAATATQAGEAPLVAQARWHYRRHWRRHYGYRRHHWRRHYYHRRHYGWRHHYHRRHYGWHRPYYRRHYGWRPYY